MDHLNAACVFRQWQMSKEVSRTRGKLGGYLGKQVPQDQMRRQALQ